jgi:hypothetical protein
MQIERRWTDMVEGENNLGRRLTDIVKIIWKEDYILE